MRVLLGAVLGLFESQYGRRPAPTSDPEHQADVDRFVELSHTAFADNGLQSDFMTDDELRY